MKQLMVLDHIAPTRVLGFFEALCAIPHGSGNTKAISDFCVAFAKKRGLEHYQDALKNVIIIAPASAGYEDAAPYILQGHLDMVCAKAPEAEIDMAREGLRLRVEGDAIYAERTSLGGDDGIAVAMALAALDDPALPHPRLEVVFTADEETGMPGAKGIDLSPLRARRMLNLDSEVEGVFTVGCAGGARVDLHWPAAPERMESAAAEVRVSGLCGGHSGLEIDAGRGNAILLLGRALRAMETRMPLHLISLRGGTAENAIPAEAVCRIALPVEALPLAAEVTAALQETLRAELAPCGDGGLCLSLHPLPAGVQEVWSAERSARIIAALTLAPNGVHSRSRQIAGLVESSLNLGLAQTDADGLCLSWSVRSSVSEGKAQLIDRLLCLGELCGAAGRVHGDYPAWEPRFDSPLCRQMAELYRRQTGEDARIDVIHAGLECGLFAAKLPGLDCVSFGPNLTDIHTPKERMSIASVQRVWDFLTALLRESKA